MTIFRIVALLGIIFAVGMPTKPINWIMHAFYLPLALILLPLDAKLESAYAHWVRIFIMGVVWIGIFLLLPRAFLPISGSMAISHLLFLLFAFLGYQFINDMSPGLGKATTANGQKYGWVFVAGFYAVYIAVASTAIAHLFKNTKGIWT